MIRVLKKAGGWCAAALPLMGAAVGSGMASGAEIREYFGQGSFVLPVVCAALMALGMVSVIRYSRVNGVNNASELCESLFDYPRPIYRLIALNSIITGAGMLSGLKHTAEAVGLPLPVLAAVALCAAGAFLAAKRAGMTAISAVMIPMLLAFLIYLAATGNFKTERTELTPLQGIKTVLFYPSYNVGMAIGLCAGMKRGSLRGGGMMFFVLISAVIILISCIAGGAEGELPVLSMLEGVPKIIYVACLSAAVITSYVAAMMTFKGRALYIAAAFTLGLSFVPLSSIIKFFYPISGISAIIIITKIFLKEKKASLARNGR